MADPIGTENSSGGQSRKPYVHLALLLLTFLSTSIAGVQWLNKDPFEISNFTNGLTYGILILAILLAHELGHFIAAKAHHVEVSLPYFIPFPSFFGLAPFGTLGALIRIRSSINSKRVLFDIGVAGPIAGFLASLFILIVGFSNLPQIDYLYSIHPEYANMAQLPDGGLTFGLNLTFALFRMLIPLPGSFIPPMNEVYHYPYLCVGWFGLFVTALNLIPVGQLDGGHITRAMFANSHQRIGQASLIVMAILGTLGILPTLGVKVAVGWIGWLIWGILLGVFFYRRKVDPIPLPGDERLGAIRNILGWACIIIFALSFTPVPFGGLD